MYLKSSNRCLSTDTSINLSIYDYCIHLYISIIFPFVCQEAVDEVNSDFDLNSLIEGVVDDDEEEENIQVELSF